MIAAERETIIRWDDEEKLVDIYTASSSMRAKLIKRGYKMEPYGVGWRIPASLRPMAKKVIIRKAGEGPPRKVSVNGAAALLSWRDKKRASGGGSDVR